MKIAFLIVSTFLFACFLTAGLKWLTPTAEEVSVVSDDHQKAAKSAFFTAETEAQLHVKLVEPDPIRQEIQLTQGPDDEERVMSFVDTIDGNVEMLVTVNLDTKEITYGEHFSVQRLMELVVRIEEEKFKSSQPFLSSVNRSSKVGVSF